MAKFGRRSLIELQTLDSRLQEILEEAIKEIDFIILQGFRGQEEQDRAFRKGFSKLKFPESKHNRLPSLAVDIAPNPLDWNDYPRFTKLGKIVLRIAEEKGVKLLWGRDFKTLKDYPHFEIVEDKDA